jgi:hypothetical protein
VRCANCGEFALDEQMVGTCSSDLRHPRLSVLVREHSLHLGPVVLYPQEPAPKIDGYAPMRIDATKTDFPTLVSDRLDRALLNLAKLSKELGQSLEVHWDAPSVLFATSRNEALYMVQSLAAAGWIENPAARSGASCLLTPNGWARVAELQSARRRDPRSPVFVAMWFGDDRTNETPSFMHDLYESYLRTAIESAGYRAERVDLIQHNDFVMEKVLGMIRVAPFVVADFTGHRTGVYFEAGFARGLGIAVVHTCKRSHFEQAHFDIKQINTIVWDTPDQLNEALYHRIVGTRGPGPFAAGTEGERRA